MVSILNLVLLFVVISFTTAYPWSGLNICEYANPSSLSSPPR
jgi:hypothetical protein